MMNPAAIKSLLTKETVKVLPSILDSLSVLRVTVCLLKLGSLDKVTAEAYQDLF